MTESAFKDIDAVVRKFHKQLRDINKSGYKHRRMRTRNHNIMYMYVRDDNITRAGSYIS